MKLVEAAATNTGSVSSWPIADASQTLFAGNDGQSRRLRSANVNAAPRSSCTCDATPCIPPQIPLFHPSSQQNKIAFTVDPQGPLTKVFVRFALQVMTATTEPAPTAASTASTDRFLRETGLAAEFALIVEPVLEGLGFRLVRVLVSGNVESIVQIMA